MLNHPEKDLVLYKDSQEVAREGLLMSGVDFANKSAIVKYYFSGAEVWRPFGQKDFLPVLYLTRRGQ